jgi:hypothetical protein
MIGASRACRACGGGDLAEVLDLGRTPLANALLTEDELQHPEAVFALNLVYCRQCALVQITETVPPEDLFRDYVYFSSFSETAVESARRLAERLTADRKLTAGHLVVEIASNDGYLLQAYKGRGIGILGIEPARNIAAVAQSAGIPTIVEFFGLDLAERLVASGTRAAVLHANNVLAHVPDVVGLVSGIREILAADGIAVIEFPYVKDLVDKVEFDTIYHEHLCYFSFSTVHRLFATCGLRIVDVERIPIHGGSLRVFAVRSDSNAAAAESVGGLLQQESAWGLTDIGFYRGFRDRVESLGNDLRRCLGELKAVGNRIAAYGASAKGSTLLNYLGIGRETLDYVVDRSTAKQGLYTPGTHLRIEPPAKLLETMPDLVLLLTWNFAEEIMAQQREYRGRGGRFILPIPTVQIC